MNLNDDIDLKRGMTLLLARLELNTQAYRARVELFEQTKLESSRVINP